MYKTKMFESHYDLQRFLNDNRIRRDDIVNISFTTDYQEHYFRSIHHILLVYEDNSQDELDDALNRLAVDGEKMGAALNELIAALG